MDDQAIRKKQVWKRVEREDKRRAAVHEAGHATAYLSFGCPARCWIERNDACGPDNMRDQLAWAGSCQRFCGPNPSPMQWATIAVSGQMAEFLDSQCSEYREDRTVIECREDPTEIADLFLEEWELGEVEFSKTDAKHIPDSDEQCREAARDAARLLIRYYPAWRKLVDRLHKDKYLSDWECVQIWKRMTKQVVSP